MYRQLILYLTLLTLLIPSTPAMAEELTFTPWVYEGEWPRTLQGPEGAPKLMEVLFPDVPHQQIQSDSLGNTRFFPSDDGDADEDGGMIIHGNVAVRFCSDIRFGPENRIDNNWLFNQREAVNEMLAGDTQPALAAIDEVLRLVPCASETLSPSPLSDILITQAVLHYYEDNLTAMETSLRNALTLYPSRSRPADLEMAFQDHYFAAADKIASERNNGGLGALHVHGTFQDLTVGGLPADQVQVVAGLQVLQFTDAGGTNRTRLLEVSGQVHPQVVLMDRATWFEVMKPGAELVIPGGTFVREATLARIKASQFAVVSFTAREGFRHVRTEEGWEAQPIEGLAELLPPPPEPEGDDDDDTSDLPLRPVRERKPFVSVDSSPGEAQLIVAGFFQMISPHPHGGGGVDGRFHINNGFSVDVGFRASAREATVGDLKGTALVFRAHAGLSMRFWLPLAPLEPVIAMRFPFHFEGREAFAVRPGVMGGGGIRILPKEEGPVSFEVLALAGGVAIGQHSQLLVDVEARAVITLPEPK